MLTHVKTWHGYDYRTNQPVELPRVEWVVWIKNLKANGGRTVRHRVNPARRYLGDDDLLLIRRGEIVAEVYDRD